MSISGEETCLRKDLKVFLFGEGFIYWLVGVWVRGSGIFIWEDYLINNVIWDSDFVLIYKGLRGFRVEKNLYWI